MKRRKKTDPALALKIARAQLRAIRSVKVTRLAGDGIHQAEPGQFIQAWAVNRGYSGVTQALDSDGQVWERVSLMDEKEMDGKKVKYVRESYWVKLSMARKDET